MALQINPQLLPAWYHQVGQDYLERRGALLPHSTSTVVLVAEPLGNGLHQMEDRRAARKIDHPT